LIKSEDVLVVDRGFRDVIMILEEYGLIPKMPNFLQQGSQYDTFSANESRLVTAIRWVVEVVNGLLRTWKMLSQVIPNSQIPYIDDFVKIVAALCNAYRPPRVEASSPDDEIIAHRMLARSRKTNDPKNILRTTDGLEGPLFGEKLKRPQLQIFHI